MQHRTSTTNVVPGPLIGAEHDDELRALWAMSASERVAAMWRGELTLCQLAKWSSRAPDEVPLLGREFAWIAMRTPDWAEAADRVRAAQR